MTNNKTLPARFVGLLITATLCAPGIAQAEYFVTTFAEVPTLTISTERAALIGGRIRQASATANGECVKLMQEAALARALDRCNEALDAADDWLSKRAEGRKYLASLHSNRGVARALLGDTDGAKHDFTAALELDEQHGDALENMSFLSTRTRSSAR